MHKFTDTLGREWLVQLTIGTAKKLKAEIGFDLVGLSRESIAELANPYRLADVLFLIVKPQAEKLGVTDESFADGLGGETIDAASEALLDAIVSFTPSGRREALRAAIAKGKEAAAKATEAAIAKMQAMSAESILGSLSTGSPGSPD